MSLFSNIKNYKSDDNEMRLQMTNKAKNPIDSFVENAKKRRKRPLSDDQINKINELIIDAEKEEVMDFKGHLIRKYSNRKLYSVTESRHVNLEFVAEQFQKGSAFIVRDAKTQEDLTIDTLVKALASSGVFNEQVERQNLLNMEANLILQGVKVNVI